MNKGRKIEEEEHLKCPRCGSDLTPTCLGCGTFYACTNPKCDYDQPCSCVDYGE